MPNYFEHFCCKRLCFNFSFASLAGILIGITSSAVRLTISTITAWIKKYNSVIKKKKKEKKHGYIVILAKISFSQ